MDSNGKIYTPEQMTAMEERARKRMQEIPDDQVVSEHPTPRARARDR